MGKFLPASLVSKIMSGDSSAIASAPGIILLTFKELFHLRRLSHLDITGPHAHWCSHSHPSLSESASRLLDVLPPHNATLTSLSLMNMNQRGDLPEALFTLRGLRVLNLSRNRYGRPPPPSTHFLDRSPPPSTSHILPKALSNLTELRVLDLSYNSFEGKLPPSLYTLERLECLNFKANRVNGPLSSSLGKVSQGGLQQRR